MSDKIDQVQTPVIKATTALAAGAGSSIAAATHQAADFLPTDAAGWAALFASCLACLYTGCLLAEWVWKKLKGRKGRREQG